MTVVTSNLISEIEYTAFERKIAFEKMSFLPYDTVGVTLGGNTDSVDFFL